MATMNEVLKKKKKSEEQTNTAIAPGTEGRAVTTSSGTDVILPKREEKALSAIGKTQQVNTVASNGTTGTNEVPVNAEQVNANLLAQKQQELTNMTPEEVQAQTNKKLGITVSDLNPEAVQQQKEAALLQSTNNKGLLQGATPQEANANAILAARIVLQQGLREGVRNAALVFDNLVLSLANKGNSLTYNSAKSGLDDAMTLLKEQVDNAKTGIVNPQDVKEAVVAAQQSISRLEASQKGLGKLNLKYWIDNGAAVETEIKLKRNQLADMERQLILSGAI